MDQQNTEHPSQPALKQSSVKNAAEFPFQIHHRPDYAFLILKLPVEQTVKVEASAMASMDSNIQMKTKFKGGFSRLLTGESIFINEFTAQGGPGELCVAPGPPGDMEHLYLNGQTVYLASSAFLAAGTGINVESKWQGLIKGMFGGNGLFLIRCSGSGSLWFNSYGAIIPIQISKEFVVDTSYVVGFTDGLQYNVTSVGGYKSLFLSGEGLVCRFQGSGTVWIQTRQAPAFASWVDPYRIVKRRSNN